MRMCSPESKKIYESIIFQTGITKFTDGMLAAHFFCRPLSRLFSIWFINHHISPNKVTMLMIIFGIIGSLFYAIPNVYCKIIGYILWILWFTMDLSDGQVARFTKQFSKYGTEMDYMAHLIDHPCMNIAILLTFLQMKVFNPIGLCIIFIATISIELVSRNITAFDYFHKKIYGTSQMTIYKKPSFLKYLIKESILYPTMIICFSWIIIVGYAYNLSWIIYLYLIWLIVFIILWLKGIVKHLVKYYESLS